jgi:1,4-alpha-glucan branching enzyme
MEDLPRKLKKKEASKTPAIIEWFFLNYPYSVAVEVKMAKNKVKEHQQAALKQVKDGTFTYKLPDMGRRNPFDFVIFKGDVHAVIVSQIAGNQYIATDMTAKETFYFNI